MAGQASENSTVLNLVADKARPGGTISSRLKFDQAQVEAHVTEPDGLIKELSFDLAYQLII